MKRSSELRANPDKVRDWQRRSRRSLKPKSDRRRQQEAAEDRPAVREAVYARDGYRCQLRDVEGAGRCFGGLTPHHKLKEGQGGKYTKDNLVTMCSSHNDRIEAEADLAAIARSLGFVILRSDL